jgi:glycosyltransferase involved in cell wall biosynthesis
MTSVIHYTNEFSPLTETFIYDFIIELEKTNTTNYVITKELVNTTSRPFPRVRLIGVRRNILARLIRRIFSLPSKSNNRELVREINEIKPTVIHCHFGTSAYDVLNCLAQIKKPLKIIVSMHGFDVFCTGNIPRNYNKVLLRLEEKGAVFTTPSNYLKSELSSRLGIAHKSIIVVGNLFNPCFMNDNPKRPAQTVINILSIGRLIDLKGFKYLIAAVKSLVANNIDVCLHLVGGGPLKSQLKRLSEPLLSQGRIKIYGQIKHPEVVRLMQSADLYIQPSIMGRGEQYESFGVALLEAIAAGLPVIATKTGGMPEVLVDLEEPYAFLIEEKSEEEIVQAVIRYIQADHYDPDTYKDMRYALLLRYDSAAIVSKVSAIYHDAPFINL